MTPKDWIQSNTNSVLRSNADVEIAIGLSNELGIPLHSDLPKNWDNLLAVNYARQFATPNDAILDAGACPGMSVFLPGMKKTHGKIWGCNNDPNVPVGRIDGANYRFADITGTDFSNQCFSFIACLSVIEHGVHLPKLIIGMNRLIAGTEWRAECRSRFSTSETFTK